MSSFFLDDIEMGEKAQQAYDAINEILGCLKPAEININRACDIINKVGICNISFRSHQYFYDELVDASNKFAEYMTVCEGYNKKVDKPFSNKYEKMIDEISDVRSEEITIKNNLGITETIKDRYGNSHTIEKEFISIEDVLSYGEIGKIIKGNYESYAEAVKENEDIEELTLNEYIDTFTKEGEINYVSEGRRNFSLFLALTPIVGDVYSAVSAIAGKDLITDEELSGIERLLYGFSAVSFIGDTRVLGKAYVRGGISEASKTFAKQFATNSAMYIGSKGVSEIVGINPILALILYQGGRIGAKNIDNIINGSKKIKETFELKKTEFKNILSSKQDSISEYLKSVEEIDGEIKIKFRDKVGEISTIILRKEELTPYNRYICFNGCFTEETIVKTQEGNKEISKIADGEKVLARDEVTGALSYKKVKVIEKLADRIIEIKLKKEEIKATSEHLFRVKEGWIKAEEIRKGLELINDKGEAEVVEEVNKVVYNNLKVYNLEVEDYHTFYVGETGILVHNSYKMPRLEEIYKTYYKNLNEEMQIKFKGVLKEIEASGDMSKLKEFDNKFTGVEVSDVSKIEEIIDGSVVKGVSEASEGVGKAKPNQVHHFATNKSKKYTKQFEDITKKYDLELDDAWNKELMPHQGRHPYAYHEYVLREMTKYDNIARGNKEKFLKLFEQLKNKVINNPDMLTKDYWK